jgi:hypothetical protein
MQWQTGYDMQSEESHGRCIGHYRGLWTSGKGGLLFMLAFWLLAALVRHTNKGGFRSADPMAELMYDMFANRAMLDQAEHGLFAAAGAFCC